MTPSTSSCPCQSGLKYSECCQPLHQGEPAASPQALMRSRFCAFALNNTAYLSSSWHHSQRPSALTLDPEEKWLALKILHSETDGDTGSVHFQATSKDRQGLNVLEEHSRFVKENGHWFYLDGTPSSTPLKPGRNDPCPCGSGKKFKKCCG
ncbi:YchJ family protein [Alcanivorax sp.]|uniref:YchJ family protein n=1 Tax=Alcanivorax sp. TaxID=1872427 RepID=UPI0032D92532